jgi:tetratricopeptide (TPR) repeat protein
MAVRTLILLVWAALFARAQSDVPLRMFEAAEKYRKGDVAGAQQIYTDLTKRGGEAAVRGADGLASIADAQGKPSEAVRILRDFAARTGNAEFSALAASRMARDGNFEDASKELIPVLKSIDAGAKMTTGTLMTVAMVQWKLSEFQSAIDLARKAADQARVAGDPLWTAAGRLAANWLADNSNYVESEIEFQTMLSGAPNDASVLNDYAYHLVVRGKDLEKALRYSQKSLELEPGEPAMLDTLGYIYYRLGRYEEAIDALADSWRQIPDETIIRAHLGQALAKRTQKSKDLEELLAALRTEPTPENNQKIGSLLIAIGK